MDGLSELLKQLNLAQADANRFLGVYRGYPLGLTILRHGEGPEIPLDQLVPRVYVAPRPDRLPCSPPRRRVAWLRP